VTFFRRLGVPPGGSGDSRSIPDMSTLPDPVRTVFEHTFGEAAGPIFWVAVPFAVAAPCCRC
jgi:hypothetical protein